MKKKLTIFSLSLCALLLLFVSLKHVNSSDSQQVFNSALNPIETREWTGDKITLKPLVILMNYTDYEYTEMDEKENTLLNNRPGEEFTSELYEEMLFGDSTYVGSDGKEYISANKYYLEQSGNSLSLKGKVYGWYDGKKDHKYYGANNGIGASTGSTEIRKNDASTAVRLVKEALQNAAKDPNIDLSEFDVEDKNDIDGDGNYFEPDGIIDSVIIIHPGKGEESPDNSLGDNAIWSFRWSFNLMNDEEFQITDQNNKVWLVDDFSILPQDIEVSTFVHEYGHLLGLPDLYGDHPPIEAWSLMAQNHTGEQTTNSLGAWPRYYLNNSFAQLDINTNWGNFKTVSLEEIDEKGTDVTLDQVGSMGKNPDTLKIELPDREYRIIKPLEGKSVYVAGKQDESISSMETEIDLTRAKIPLLKFKLAHYYDTETAPLSIMVREKGTHTWSEILGSFTPYIDTDENSSQYSSDTEDLLFDQWLNAEYNLNEFAGKIIELKISCDVSAPLSPEYWVFVDNIKIVDRKKIIFVDNAERKSKFSLKGFSKYGGSEYFEHYYLLEWRNNKNILSDQGLGNVLDVLKYDTGLVIWYINTKWKYGDGIIDQYTAGHPGESFATIIDADQNLIEHTFDNGESSLSFPVIQMHDAAFSLHNHSETFYRDEQQQSLVIDYNTFFNPVFDDSEDYSNIGMEELGANLINYGLKIFVTDESSDRSSARIHLAKTSEDSYLQAQQLDEKFIDEISITGDTLKINTLKKINSMKVGYALYSNYGKICNVVDMENKGYSFEGKLYFMDGLDDGIYEIEFIQIQDSEGNTKGIYNSLRNSGYGIDLSAGNFNTIFRVHKADLTKNSRNSYKLDLLLSNRTCLPERCYVAVSYFQDGKIVDSKVENFNIQPLDKLEKSIEIEKMKDVDEFKIYLLDSYKRIIKTIK